MENKEVAGKKRLKLGEILVNAGLLREEELLEMLELQKKEGERLGFLLITRMYVTEGQLVQALSKQLSVPWVSLTHLDITPELMKLVPHDVAVTYGVVPVYIMSRRTGGKTLYVAMDDPTNEDVLNNISQNSGMEVKPMIAAPSEITTAIRRFYRSKWEPGEKLVETLKRMIEEKNKRRQEQVKESPEGVVVLPQTAIIEEVGIDEGRINNESVVALKEGKEDKTELKLGEEREVRETETKIEEVNKEEAKLREEVREGKETIQEDGKDEIFLLTQEADMEQGEYEEGGVKKEVKEGIEEKGTYITLLNGTKIFIGHGFVTKATQPKISREEEILKKMRSFLDINAGNKNVTIILTGIVEILIKRGFITLDEMDRLIKKMEEK